MSLVSPVPPESVLEKNPTDRLGTTSKGRTPFYDKKVRTPLV